MSNLEHQRDSKDQGVRVAIITLSDTRSASTDKSGDAIEHALTAAALLVAQRYLLRENPDALRTLLEQLTSDVALDAIITTGGTGLSPRDRTVDVLRGVFDFELPGFGELFRMLSWQQVRAAAMLSRATAGVWRGKLIFALPGSSAAVELAMRELIIPELRHAIAQLHRLPETSGA